MKKRLIIVFIITIIVVLLISLFFISKKSNMGIEKEIKYSIKSDFFKKIESKNIRVESIDFVQEEDYIDVKVIMKNISDKDIKGFDISIDLMDGEGKKVTSISLNTKDIIKAKENYTFYGTAMIEDKNVRIKEAKIVELNPEAGSSIEESFDEIEEIIEK